MFVKYKIATNTKQLSQFQSKQTVTENVRKVYETQ